MWKYHVRAPRVLEIEWVLIPKAPNRPKWVRFVYLERYRLDSTSSLEDVGKALQKFASKCIDDPSLM